MRVWLEKFYACCESEDRVKSLILEPAASRRTPVERGGGQRCLIARARSCLLDDGQRAVVANQSDNTMRPSTADGRIGALAGQDGLCGRHARIRVSRAGAGPSAQLALSHAQSALYVMELGVYRVL